MISDHIKGINADLSDIKAVLEDLPQKIKDMLKTLKEMKIGSEPDDTADYWEEREAIATHTKNL